MVSITVRFQDVSLDKMLRLEMAKYGISSKEKMVIHILKDYNKRLVDHGRH